MDPLGGLFDQFFGPDGLDGLEDLFGLGPDGSPTPDDLPGGSGMADQLLRQLLEELLQSMTPEGTAPQPLPGDESAPAPDGPSDSSADAMQQLMEELMDELFQGLGPNGLPDPFAPDSGSDGQGI
jgi:Rod binding domain-containing protein